MDLPPPLRRGVELALAGVPMASLAKAAEALSERYRAEVRDGRFHLADDLTARAYLATRLPATYAAIRTALAAVAETRPDFAPRTLIDVGAGPGTALWAVADRWPGLAGAHLIEGCPAIRSWGERLMGEGPVADVEWLSTDILRRLPDLPRADIVTLSYVLSELPPEVRDPLIDWLWSMSTELVLIVEPGTPAGWERVLRARARLIAAGAHIVAPCPHALRCPLLPPDWCHFSARLSRSRSHRLVKGADLSWEDEKCIYLAVSRRPGAAPRARVIAKPRLASGQVRLKLCNGDGTGGEQLFSRREGEAYKAARRKDWGDALAL